VIFSRSAPPDTLGAHLADWERFLYDRTEPPLVHAAFFEASRADYCDGFRQVTERTFEFADLLGDQGLGDLQCGRGARQAALRRHGPEATRVVATEPFHPSGIALRINLRVHSESRIGPARSPVALFNRQSPRRRASGQARALGADTEER
jgi:hypothetical protein